MISEISIIPRIPPSPDANPPVQKVAAVQTTSATFQINSAKLYVPNIAFSINDNIKLLLMIISSKNLKLQLPGTNIYLK